jgi:tRNA:m(5)U-54 methyltransferase
LRSRIFLCIHVIGGGLAGPEAALQAASLGCHVILSEMRPLRSTEAHQTSDFAELVCSNSLKSESENTAPWLLKQEMRRANSFLLQAADASAVPAGHALAVDRIEFSRRVADLIAATPTSKSAAKKSRTSTRTIPTPSPSSPAALSPARPSPPNSNASPAPSS